MKQTLMFYYVFFLFPFLVPCFFCLNFYWNFYFRNARKILILIICNKYEIRIQTTFTIVQHNTYIRIAYLVKFFHYIHVHGPSSFMELYRIHRRHIHSHSHTHIHKIHKPQNTYEWMNVHVGLHAYMHASKDCRAKITSRRLFVVHGRCGVAKIQKQVKCKVFMAKLQR